MTTPLNKFKEWLETYSATEGYTLSRGAWIETSDSSGKKFIAMRVEGGRKPNIVIRYPSIRLIVTGRRDKPEDSESVYEFANGIIDAAIEHYSTDCIADVQPLGDVIGPGLTEANRVWYEVNFQLVI